MLTQSNINIEHRICLHLRKLIIHVYMVIISVEGSTPEEAEPVLLI